MCAFSRLYYLSAGQLWCSADGPGRERDTGEGGDVLQSCFNAGKQGGGERGRAREGGERERVGAQNCWHVKIQTKPLGGKRTYAVAKLNTAMKDSR